MQKFTVIRASKALQKQRRAKSSKQQPKQVVLVNKRKQPKPRRQPKPPRQNQTRAITDFPLGNSQRQGFNRNSASKTVTKDEYIADVAGTVAFTTTQYAVNPGQSATFPWLAIEAKQWEKYEFQKLEFYLKPEVTQYTTNANSGKVILSFDSDASDPPPLNKQEAEDVMPMADGMSYQTVNLNIPKFILQSHHDSFYVRPGNLPGGADIKTYDLGNLFVSTIGQGGAVPNMMELRVRYTCTLMIPILENTLAAPQNNQVSVFVDSIQPLTTATPYQPVFAAAATTALPVTNGLNVSNVGTLGVLIPPPGNYLLDVSSNFYSSAQVLGLCFLNVLKNSVVQCPGGNTYTSTQSNSTNVEAYCTCNFATYLSMNGTDTLKFSIEANFATGTASATTVVRLTSI